MCGDEQGGLISRSLNGHSLQNLQLVVPSCCACLQPTGRLSSIAWQQHNPKPQLNESCSRSDCYIPLTVLTSRGLIVSIDVLFFCMSHRRLRAKLCRQWQSKLLTAQLGVAIVAQEQRCVYLQHLGSLQVTFVNSFLIALTGRLGKCWIASCMGLT